jgi:ribosomal protein S18 acetylase RimI-like enzyme
VTATIEQPCRMLPWDTGFFGVRVATVDAQTLTDDSLRDINAFCTANAVECLYFRARPDDAATVRLAEASGFHLVDVRLTSERLTPYPGTPGEGRGGGSAPIRAATTLDLPFLAPIARLSHTDTRFYYDPRFPRAKCDQLYETWITNAVTGQALTVLVATDAQDHPIGYVTCDGRADSSVGSIGLIAVSGEHQGKGLGKLLVNSALDWFARNGRKSVSVVTQGRNLAAQRLYGRCGFIARDLQLYYHRWF